MNGISLFKFLSTATLVQFKLIFNKCSKQTDTTFEDIFLNKLFVIPINSMHLTTCISCENPVMQILKE